MSDLSEIRHELTALREVMARTSADVAWIKERTGDHADQIRSVERRQWWLSGLSTAIGALLGIGGSHGLKL